MRRDCRNSMITGCISIFASRAEWWPESADTTTTPRFTHWTNYVRCLFRRLTERYGLQKLGFGFYRAYIPFVVANHCLKNSCQDLGVSRSEDNRDQIFHFYGAL